jgi:membrane protein
MPKLAAVKSFPKILLRSAMELYSGIYLHQAASLAFTTLLTIVPLIIVTVYVMSIFPAFNDQFLLAKEYVFSNFVPTSREVIETYLNNFSEKASTLPVTSILFLGASVLMLIVFVKNIMNEIWGSPRYKNIINSIKHYILVMCLPMLILFGIILTSILMASNWYNLATDYLHIKFIASLLMSFIINTLCFMLLYWGMPNCKVSISYALVGGVLASLLFELAKVGFVYYLYVFPSYELIYGALAVIPIFLIWIYISWSIIIYGALVTKELQDS